MFGVVLQTRRSGFGNAPGALLLVLVGVGVTLSLAILPGGAPTAGRGGDSVVETQTVTPANRTAETSLYDAENVSFDDAATVERAIENGTLDPAGTVTPGDALVVAIESPRLVASMDDHEGSTTDRFVAALDGEADLRIVQTNPNTMVTRTYASVGPANVTAYRDGSTVYAVLDTDEMVFRKEMAENETRRVDSFRWDRFAIDFGFDLYEPPWKPGEEGLFGPRFELTDEEYLTETSTTTTTLTTPTRAGSTTPSTPEQPTPSPTRAPSSPTGAITSPTETAERSKTATPGTSTATDGPGFTPPALLAAVAVVTLVALRRRR